MPDMLMTGVRAAQIVFAAVVTGLSINLAHGHHWGPVPAALGFVSFVGCFSLLGAFVGVAAEFVDLLKGPIGMAVDGLVLILNLAGGVAVAVKVRGIDCNTNLKKTASGNSKVTLGDLSKAQNIIVNGLMNGGWKGEADGSCYYCITWSQIDTLLSRCKQNQADAAFMILTVVVIILAGVVRFLRK